MAQIGCYMTDAGITELEEYAKTIEITRTAVFALIVQRELRAPRLRRSRTGRVQGPPATGDTGPGGRRRVTVHIRNGSLKRAFTRHVKSLAMGSDEAALALIAMELKERWLFKTFGFSENHD